jgi:hypothetical protein
MNANSCPFDTKVEDNMSIICKDSSDDKNRSSRENGI